MNILHDFCISHIPDILVARTAVHVKFKRKVWTQKFSFFNHLDCKWQETIGRRIGRGWGGQEFNICAGIVPNVFHWSRFLLGTRQSVMAD
jgi:hypothetical protein